MNNSSSQDIVEKVLSINGFSLLNPVQIEAVKYLDSNLVIASPTASGKTTIFEIAMIKTILQEGKKAIYISPLKALTYEHYSETKRKYAKEFNLKIGISTGDLDSSSKNLKDYDVLFLTYEKFDSVLRHNPFWIKDIGLLTIDEVHEIGSDRGATLEILITQIKLNFPKIKLLCLSATIGNSKELASWLSAKLIESSYRPVPLEIGIYYDNKIFFENREKELKAPLTKKEKDLPLAGIIKDTLEQDKQLIVFCNSRANTMSFASKYSEITKNYIKDKDKNKLREIGKTIGEVLEKPTKQCLALYSSITTGAICFHHAGLVHKQRRIIEDEFKNKNIKLIFATPTLAAGINLPAYRVIINNIYRFQDNSMVPIPVNEFFQMCGRAGRPKYDSCGEAIAIASKEADISKIYNTYVNAEPSNIESKLSRINLLRTQLLSIIVSNNLSTIEQILKYISNTFYGYVYGNLEELKITIEQIISEFNEYKYLEVIGSNLIVTDLGRKVCLLYLDPLSAHNIIEDLLIKNQNKNLLEDTETIYTLINTTEVSPYIRYKKEEEAQLFEVFENLKSKINFDYEDLHLLEKVYESQLLADWINETSEDLLIEKYNTTPGQLQEIVNRVIWINHCTLELCNYTSSNLELKKKYLKLKLRLKYGIKEELVNLVELKNIGRVRARSLFTRGIKTIKDIENNPEKFISIVGSSGKEALKQLGIKYGKEENKKLEKDLIKEKEDVEKIKSKKQDATIKKQSKLFDF
ncbi:MAG: DEAD/DEAH box helicase [archaeon]